MSDVINVAADALLPILAAGGGAVATGAASEAGAELYKAATSVIAKIAHWIRGRPDISKADIVDAIRAALDDGSLTMTEIDRLSAAHLASAQANYHVGSVKAETSFVGNTTIHELRIDRHGK